MLINNPHSCIPTAWSSCTGKYYCRSICLLKWKKNVSLELSILYFMNTTKCSNFSPAYSRHIQGYTRWLFCQWREPVLSKDEQTFGIYMWADIGITAFVGNHWTFTKSRPAKAASNKIRSLCKKGNAWQTPCKL